MTARILTSIGQSFDDLCDGTPLLSDGNVDTIQFLLFIGSVIETFLVDDGIDGHGSFTARQHAGIVHYCSVGDVNMTHEKNTLIVSYM